MLYVMKELQQLVKSKRVTFSIREEEEGDMLVVFAMKDGLMTSLAYPVRTAEDSVDYIASILNDQLRNL